MDMDDDVEEEIRIRVGEEETTVLSLLTIGKINREVFEGEDNEVEEWDTTVLYGNKCSLNTTCLETYIHFLETS